MQCTADVATSFRLHSAGEPIIHQQRSTKLTQSLVLTLNISLIPCHQDVKMHLFELLLPIALQTKVHNYFYYYNEFQ